MTRDGVVQKHMVSTNLERENKRTKAYQMRLAGMTYDEIGLALDMQPMTVWRWIKRGIEEQQKPLEAEIRAIELDRYDRYLVKLEPMIEKGDVKSIGVALKISEARCRILGIVAPPVVTENNVTVIHASNELQEVLQAARARLAIAGESPEPQPAVAPAEAVAAGRTAVVGHSGMPQGGLSDLEPAVPDLGPAPYLEGEIVDMPSDFQILT